jgi:tetratricopeptide (TPR) repeat protein
MRKLFRELRRREVFRTAGLYVGISWIAIEAASVLLPTFDAPDWVMRAVVIAAIVGFPITVVLAWIYDVTDKGIVVQGDPTDTYVAPIGGRKMDFVVIGLLSVALVFSVYMNIMSGPAVAEEKEPVSVLIADFDNQTGDDLFNGTLEQALQIGIEGASFITSYRRDEAKRIASAVQTSSTLDEAAARLVALREGIKLVLAGSITEDGGKYVLSVHAVDPRDGETVADVKVTAKNKLEVLTVVGLLASDLREELGDDSLDEIVASETFTTTNLEAVQAYTAAQSLQFNGKYGEAIEHYQRAVEHDPQLGRAYSGWALSARSLGREQEAADLWEKALSNLDTMTERERLRTLGLYYSQVTRNRQKSIESYETLVEKYPADDTAHNGLAIQYFYTLDFQKALKQGSVVLDIYPGSVMGRSNYALYAMYASDFETAVTAAEKVRELDPSYFKAWLPVAMKAMSEGNYAAAGDAYGEMAKAGATGASTAALGLADIAIFTGEYERARDILTQGIADDEAAGNSYGMAAKQMALAEVLNGLGQRADAIGALSKGLELNARESSVVPAGLMYIAAGRNDDAEAMAQDLSQKLHPQSRAYANLIRGLANMNAGRHVEAIDALNEGLSMADLWLLRFYLGRAYLEGGFFAEALDEFIAAGDRQGEAASVFLDDLPTYRYLSTLPYWLARAQEKLGMRDVAVENYTAFIARRPDSDPLADDARQRMH